METKHSPLPWTTTEHELAIVIRDARGEVLASINGFLQEDPANAEYIVRACNAHEALVGALEFIVNDCPEPGEDAQLTPAGYNRACAAIAIARGEAVQE